MTPNDTLWLSPLLLLPGCGLLIMSTSSRYSRLHEELHHLMHHASDEARSLVASFRMRSRLFRNALVLMYLSVALFALGGLAGGMASGTDASLRATTGDTLLVGLTFAGILLLLVAAAMLVLESLASHKIIEAHLHELERGAGPDGNTAPRSG